MKRQEILELLQKGYYITRTRHMIFKNSKLKKGSTYEYHINDVKITSSQFDSIEYRLKQVRSDSIHEQHYIFNI